MEECYVLFVEDPLRLDFDGQDAWQKPANPGGDVLVPPGVRRFVLSGCVGREVDGLLRWVEPGSHLRRADAFPAADTVTRLVGTDQVRAFGAFTTEEPVTLPPPCQAQGSEFVCGSTEVLERAWREELGPWIVSPLIAAARDVELPQDIPRGLSKQYLRLLPIVSQTSFVAHLGGWEWLDVHLLSTRLTEYQVSGAMQLSGLPVYVHRGTGYRDWYGLLQRGGSLPLLLTRAEAR